MTAAIKLAPIDRNAEGRPTREEHEAWVREVYARHYPGDEPRSCDCGYWADDWLVVCHDRHRKHCRRDVEGRLRETYKRLFGMCRCYAEPEGSTRTI